MPMGRDSENLRDNPSDLKDDLNSAEKIVLLLLGANRKKAVPGNLWLQKEIFEVSDSLPELKDFLEYEPHLQGPFSETVNNLTEDLQYLGLVQKERSGWHLTEQGKVLAEAIEKGTDSDILNIIENTKRKLNDLSKDELLVYIYYKHPEMTTESLEKEDLDKKRSKVAAELYERGKVDLEQGADLAGETTSKFKERAK